MAISTKPLNIQVSFVRLLFKLLVVLSNWAFHGRDMVVGRSVKDETR